MRKILIIGIGAGDPDYLTVQAIKALNQADVFFMPDKGAEKTELRQLRLEILERFVEGSGYRVVDFEVPRRRSNNGYLAGVDEWHGQLATRYERLFAENLSDQECGAFLVWGDPALYDSTLRIIERVRSTGFAVDCEVIPGISAVQALAARHRVALNGIGEPVLITTGRRLAEGTLLDSGSVVVMLDGEQAFTRVETPEVEIYWGAYLGTDDEILISGRLSEVKEEIARVRSRAREDKGWIMDTYLLQGAKK
jgi:precorrin-6A synthase